MLKFNGINLFYFPFYSSETGRIFADNFATEKIILDKEMRYYMSVIICHIQKQKNYLLGEKLSVNVIGMFTNIIKAVLISIQGDHV